MWLVAVKLTITPAVIALATLVARRFGAVGLAVGRAHAPLLLLAGAFLMALPLTAVAQLGSLPAVRRVQTA